MYPKSWFQNHSLSVVTLCLVTLGLVLYPTQNLLAQDTPASPDEFVDDASFLWQNESTFVVKPGVVVGEDVDTTEQFGHSIYLPGMYGGTQVGAASVDAVWRDIHYITFESSTPWPYSKWITYDCSYTSSQGIWSTTFSKAYLSTKSVHVRGGTTPYNYNTCTWMRYGPFSLASALDARVSFYYWLDSEVGYDFFRWEATCGGNGVAYWGQGGQARSGNVGSWATYTISLKNCIGSSNNYIQFMFTSDQSVNYQGVWLDNIRIQQYY